MRTKINKITKLLVISGMVLSANQAFAQKIPFPEIPYTPAHMQAEGCDPRVYNELYIRAKNEYDARYTSLEKTLVRDQLEATPKKATNSMLKCVDGAASHIDGLVSSIEGVYSKILGILSLDPKAIAMQAANRLADKACNAVDNYISSEVYSAVSPYTSMINSAPSSLVNIGNIDTPVGDINLGRDILTGVNRNSPPPPRSTVVRDGIQDLGNTVGDLGGWWK